MLDAILSTLTVQAGSALIGALLEGRSLNSSDASSLVTTLLKTIIAGQEKAESDLQRLEKKFDARARDPYESAMDAGSRLLSDAALPHRRPDDRERMLSDARLRFADAAGSSKAPDRRLDHARAEAMYGLTWLALGSPDDVALAFTRAAADLEEEMLISFALTCRDEQAWERRRNDPMNRLKESILGPSMTVPDSASSDRFWRARGDHQAVQQFRRSMDGGASRYPIVPQPHGSIYSIPTAGLVIQVLANAAIMGLRIELGLKGASVINEREQPVVAAVAPVERDSEGRLAPSTAALNRPPGPVVVGSGKRVVLAPPSTARPMLCVRLGSAEGVDLLAKFHSEIGERPLVGLRPS